jgi:hypothetical protein
VYNLRYYIPCMKAEVPPRELDEACQDWDLTNGLDVSHLFFLFSICLLRYPSE